MKGTLFSADFIKDPSDNLRLLEFNTDTGFRNGLIPDADFTDFFSVLSSNNIDTLDIIYKPGHRSFVTHLSESLQGTNIITTFNKHEEDFGTIYPTSIEDADNKFILRLAYDESAIFDSTYCKSTLELHKLFIDASVTGSMPSMFVSSSEVFHDGLSRTFNNSNSPDLVVKGATSAHQPLKLYKVPTSDDVSAEDSYTEFLNTTYNESDIVMNYIDTEANTHSSIRSFNIIYGSNLDIIHLATLESSAIFDKPSSLTLSGSSLSSKHYYEFTTNFPKYVSDVSFGGLFEEEMITDSDGNPVQISNATVGDSFKSFYIEGTPDTDNISVFTSWMYQGQTLPTGSYVTSSVLVNTIEQPLPNNLISHIYYGSGSFRANGGQHILIYDSAQDVIRYEEIAQIIPGTHQVFKLDGTLIDITDNDFEVLNEEGLSTYILDLEETDTFALHDVDINIKIVTHNCFPEGTRILLNNGTYKNIEDLTTSDVLLTYNKDEGKYGAGNASSIRISTQTELIHIVTENGEEIKSTPLHRFYVEEHGWSHAQDIKVGDSLFNKDGIIVKVKSIDSLKGEFKVYHLIDVKDNHTYFAEDVLVHNFKIISGCFIAGTEITLANGDIKNIEDVVVGEDVLTYNEKSGEQESGIVGDLKQHEVSSVIRLTLDNENIIFTTGEHPFFVEGKGWVKAGELQQLDVCKKVDGSQSLISTVEVLEETHTVYNLLSVSENHNFYANGILVHNK
jgi:hypothetical protein